MMTPINPETPLAVTLTAAEWNQVLAILSDAPYRTVATIIGKITEQASAAAVAAAPPAPNGKDDHAPDR
jgi:hypothetical protein